MGSLNAEGEKVCPGSKHSGNIILNEGEMEIFQTNKQYERSWSADLHKKCQRKLFKLKENDPIEPRL